MPPKISTDQADRVYSDPAKYGMAPLSNKIEQDTIYQVGAEMGRSLAESMGAFIEDLERHEKHRQDLERKTQTRRDYERAKRKLYDAQRTLRHARDAAMKEGIL